MSQSPGITADQRLARFLSYGFFPAELPPAFTSVSFGEKTGVLRARWDDSQLRTFRSRPEGCTIPRHTDARRRLSIINPVNQFHTSKLIADNWTDIEERLRRSTTSEFRAAMNFFDSGRAIKDTDYDRYEQRRVQILANFGRAVKTDITRFYPSIYTHSIPWAILGKVYCKEHLNDSAFRSSYANLLDYAVQGSQEGQTIGIPIGPDTSRVLSELIAVGVEQDVKALIPEWDAKAFRLVDDILVGFSDDETQYEIISGLSAALNNYQLELNAPKTNIIGVGSAHKQGWIHFIRSFKISARRDTQRADLGSFFETSLYLSELHQNDNVLAYAARRALYFAIDPHNNTYFSHWLLYLMRRSGTCMKTIIPYMLFAQHDATAQRDVESFVRQQILKNGRSAHVHELVWLLFWAREARIQIKIEILQPALNLPSSAVALLILDLNNRGLIDGTLDDSIWRASCNNDGLSSEMWLVAYQATKMKIWTSEQNLSFIKQHPFFTHLLSNDVDFYNTTPLVAPATTAPSQPEDDRATLNLYVGGSSVYP